MSKKSPKKPMDNCDVGYGRPPKSSRWKKGQSGNPKGRKKGRKNQATIFLEVMNQKITFHENGKRRTITVLEGVIRRLAADALKGGTKATSLVLAMRPEIERQLAEQKITLVTEGMTAKEAADAYASTLKGGLPGAADEDDT